MGLGGRAGVVGGVVSAALREADLIQVQRELALRPSGGLRRFIKMAWPQVRPGDRYSHNWSIDAVSEHLEAVSRGEITRLIINQPPGTMKSLMVCVFWPVWEWLAINASLGYYLVSFDGSLMTKQSERALDLIQSPFFRARWGDRVSIKGARPGTEMYETVQGGFRFATSIGGVGLGRHPDRQIIDDPTKPQEMTAVSLERPKKYVRDTLGFRFRDIQTGARVIIMQRLHEDDLAGALLEGGDYVHLRLPMYFEAANPSVTTFGGRTWRDPRTDEGELLWPERFSGPALAKIEKELASEGPNVIAAQLQQRPAPKGGMLFQDGWFGFWIDPLRLAAGYTMDHLTSKNRRWKELPERFDRELLSLDATFKETAGSDFVALGHWGQLGADNFLTDVSHERADLPKTIVMFEDMVSSHPAAIAKLIEDKANGPAVIAMLKSKIAGMIPINPEGGKVVRANAAAPIYKSGNVWLPDPAQDPVKYKWVAKVMAEHTSFPFAKHDDLVDMCTQAINYMHDSSMQLQAMLDALERQGAT